MRVRMNEDRLVAIDGIHVVELAAEETYELPDGLAERYLAAGQAEESDETAAELQLAEEAPAGQAAANELYPPAQNTEGRPPEDTSEGPAPETPGDRGAPEDTSLEPPAEGLPPIDLEKAGYHEKLAYYNEHLRAPDTRPLNHGTAWLKLNSAIAEALAQRQ